MKKFLVILLPLFAVGLTIFVSITAAVSAIALFPSTEMPNIIQVVSIFMDYCSGCVLIIPLLLSIVAGISAAAIFNYVDRLLPVATFQSIYQRQCYAIRTHMSALVLRDYLSLVALASRLFVIVLMLIVVAALPLSVLVIGLTLALAMYTIVLLRKIFDVTYWLEDYSIYLDTLSAAIPKFISSVILKVVPWITSLSYVLDSINQRFLQITNFFFKLNS